MPLTLVREDNLPQFHVPGELALVRAIPFQALCEEHLLPFYGAVHIGYLRSGKPLRQPRFTQIVEACSNGIQIQQRMTARIGLWLHHELAPHGVGVLVEGAYACAAESAMAQPGSTTLAFYGALRRSADAQRDFITRTRDELVKLGAE